MTTRPLKIGLWASGFGRGTGPSTYFDSLRTALAGRHCPCLTDGAGGSGLDLIHIVDAKRVKPGLLDTLARPAIADFHDDYWIDPPGFPAPDAFLRRLRGNRLRAHHLEVMKRARAVIVHSQAAARSFREALDSLADGPDERRPDLFVVNYGIDAEAFGEKADPPAPASHGQGAPAILFVGRDLYRKGFAVMAEALPLVLARVPDARLIAIGDEYPHTRILARRLVRGLPVTFLPGQSREALAAHYRDARVLVLPSWREAFGIALIEAMASGLPVVAARTGGIPEAVEDRVSGLLHHPGDAADLADKIVTVLTEPKEAVRLRQEGRKRAGRFNLAAMADALDEVYGSIIGAGP